VDTRLAHNRRVHQGAPHERTSTAPGERASAATGGPARARGRRARAATDASAGGRGLHHRPRQYRSAAAFSLLVHEPLGADEPVDYAYLYGVIVERAVREEDLAKTLDAKITALLAGVVGFIGFSFRLPVSPWSAGSTLIYLIPLGFLLSAFLTKRGPLAPNVESMETFYPEYPVTTMRKAARAVSSACRVNQQINDQKAARLEIATALTAISTGIALAVQLVIALR
jgi:hypothetical protein